MLLTLVLLRKGYITRYLCERLAFGLAPENIEAFFVQRQRGRAAAPKSCFCRKVRLAWPQLHPSAHVLAVALAVAKLHHDADGRRAARLSVDRPYTAGQRHHQSVLDYIVPMILALIGGLKIFAPTKYFPFASQVLGSFQSFKILPTVLLTLIKPFGHAFKVTPKGRAARRSNYDRGIFWTAAGLIFLTIGGLVLNSMPETQIIDRSSLLPVMVIWGVINVIVLFLVCMMSVQAPAAAIRRALYA